MLIFIGSLKKVLISIVIFLKKVLILRFCSHVLIFSTELRLKFRISH